mgnify:CR=1 FL=1
MIQGKSGQLQDYFKQQNIYNSNIQNRAQDYTQNAPNFGNLQNPLGGFGGIFNPMPNMQGFNNNIYGLTNY